MRTRHPWLHGQLYSAEDDLTPDEMARVAAAAAEALRGAEQAARQLGADWALIGGQALGRFETEVPGHHRFRDPERRR